jgi:hypothetical protein
VPPLVISAVGGASGTGGASGAPAASPGASTAPVAASTAASAELPTLPHEHKHNQDIAKAMHPPRDAVMSYLMSP